MKRTSLNPAANIPPGSPCQRGMVGTRQPDGRCRVRAGNPGGDHQGYGCKPAQSAAPALADGLARSAWPDVDPAGRAFFLEQFLVSNPHLELRGGVNYESLLEPVVFDRETGDRFSLSGELVSSDSGGLVVPIFDGQLQSAGAIWALAFLGFALLVFLETRK